MRTIVYATVCALLSAPLFAGLPDPVKSRFVVGDAVWREIPIRDDLLHPDHRELGRSHPKGDWVYNVQVSIKFT